MSYKNTMKLFASNFALVWKQLVYLACCLVLFLLCSYTIISPVVDLLKINSIGIELEVIFDSVYKSPNEIALRLSEIIKHIINVLLDNFSTLWPNIFGTLIFCLLLPYILVQMSIYNTTSILGQKLTMNMDVPYMQNALKTFKQSLKYAFANILFNLPFFVLTIVMLEIYLIISKTIISALIGLFALSTLLIILYSLKTSFFAYYTAYMVDNEAGPFVSFAKGVIKTIKNFWKILSISIVITLTILVVNGFVALFTFFSGLFVTIPASFILYSIYYLITYYGIKGERYYLSDTIIFNPVKHVIRKDDYVSVSVPEVTKEIEVTTTVMKKKYKKSKSNKKNKKG